MYSIRSLTTRTFERPISAQKIVESSCQRNFFLVRRLSQLNDTGFGVWYYKFYSSPRLSSFQNEGKLCTPKYDFNECYICFGGSILLIFQTLKPNREVPELFRNPVFHDMISQGFVFSWVAQGISLCDRQIRALLPSTEY